MRQLRGPATAIVIAAGLVVGVPATRVVGPRQALTTSPMMSVRLATTGTRLPPAAGTDRINDDKGGFSYEAPAGWTPSNTGKLTYGSALLTNPSVPNGLILLGALDMKLFASAYPSYPDNRKAAVRLASDMGEFLMPYTGNRLSWEDQAFGSDGPDAWAAYDTKYDDPKREDSQMWAAVVGNQPNRFFVVWRGSASAPIDRMAAGALALSIVSY
ncbi:APA family fibronectin-binding glycoprotein [Mycobacteroides abscessus]|uniref:APA family fibronectin-binding glycoprotein n=2 Tax=Mycobacteroides abscessus TaxID=36809 RepID=UPI0009A77641|nr:APA family fibronectin-binding glycoprotein [Mycobacteroides abscessus]